MSTYRDTVLSDGPVGYWRLGESAGSTSLEDASGRGNPLSLVAPVSLGIPGAVHGDGDAAASFPSTGYATTASDVKTTHAQGSVECWVDTTQWGLDNVAHGIYQNVTGWGNQANGISMFRWSAGTSDASPFYFRVVSPGAAIQDIVAPWRTYFGAGGGWHHLVGTWDSTQMSLYVDGALVASRSYTPPATPSSPATRVSQGHSQGGAGHSLDEFAVYDRALTAKEILEHYVLGSTGRFNVSYETLAAGDTYQTLIPGGNFEGPGSEIRAGTQEVDWGYRVDAGDTYFWMNRNQIYPGVAFDAVFARKKYLIKVRARVPSTSPSAQSLYSRVSFKDQGGGNLWPAVVWSVPNDGVWRDYTYTVDVGALNPLESSLNNEVWVQHAGTEDVAAAEIHVNDVRVALVPTYGDINTRHPTYASLSTVIQPGTSYVIGGGDSAATTSTERRDAGNVTTGGLVTAVGRHETSRVVSLSTGGEVTATGRQETSRAVVLSTGGEIAAAGQGTKSGSASVTGAGDAAATTSTTRLDSQSISTGGSVIAEVQEVALATSGVTGTGDSVAAGDKTTTATRVVTGTGEAATSATTTRDGTAGVSGSGNTSLAVIRIHDRTTSLTTGGSVLATPGVPERGVAAEVTAVAQTAISATTTRSGTAGIDGTGATTADATRESDQDSSVSAAETVEAVGSTDRTSPDLSSTTSATTSTSGLSDRSTAAEVSGSGTTFTAWYPIASVTSVVTGGGSVATTYWHEILERDGTASVTGTGAVDAAGDAIRLDAGTVTGTGVVDAGGAGDRAGAAQVTGTGEIAAEGRAEAAGAAVVSGSGATVTTSVGEREAEVVVSTPTRVASLAATSEPGQVSVSISGGGTIATDGNFEIPSPVLGMSAAGRVDAAGGKSIRRGVAVVARGRVTTSAQEQNSGTSGVSGGGSVGAAGLKDWATVADVSGLIRLQSTARATRLAETLVSGTGAVVTFWEARLGRWVNYDRAHVTGGGSVSHVGIRIQREWLWAESEELWREAGFDPRHYVALLREQSGKHGIYPVPAGVDAVRAQPDYTPVPSAPPDDLWALAGGDTALYVRLVREKEFRDSQGVT